MKETFKDFLERKYAEGVDPSKAGRLLRQEVERTSDLPSNPYREANDDQ